MQKYILTSLLTLLTYSAYGAFDFENYTPTLTKLYFQGMSDLTSAYTLSFEQVQNNNLDNVITTYSANYNDYTFIPTYYTYSYNTLNNSTNGIEPIEIKTSIEKISKDFINKTVSDNYKSLIEIFAPSSKNITINNINTDFVNNDFVGVGTSAIQLSGFGNLIVGSVNSNFIGNSFANNIISNASDVDIFNLAFINNKNTSINANLFTNTGTITALNGDFINNDAGRSLIHNSNAGIIDTINGNFVNNTSSYGGVIWVYMNANIGLIKGNFIGNQGGYGSAIKNEGTINKISSNFINNGGTSAVFTNQNLTFVSDEDHHLFAGNNRAITSFKDLYSPTNILLTFNNKNTYSYTINDKIDTYTSSTTYNMNITGDRTGYTQFNNEIYNANIVNINNGKMVFGKTPEDYIRNANIGHFAGINPTINLTNGIFDIANGYTESIILNGLNSTGNNNFLLIDLDTENKLADIINVETNITGQINLVVNALSNLDIDNYVIWFANATSDNSPFNLYSVSGLDYSLQLYVDSENHKYGLVKDGITNPEEYVNSNTPDNPDEPEIPDEPSEPDTPDTPDNPDTPVIPDEPEQQIQPTITVLPVEVVQLADYTAKTVTNTVQKLTNSMQKRVGELQWLSKETDTESGLNNAFWTRGIHKNFDTKDTSLGLSGIEFGYDRIISSNNNYKWYIGGLGYISGGDSKFKDNKLDISGYGLGAYLMVLEKSGWFADAVFRQHFINMETSDVKTDYTASSFNLEIGKEFVFGSDTDKLKWFMKPSLEGTYISISGTDIGSFKVQNSTSSMASLSVLAGPRWDFASGRKFQTYGKVGYTLDNSDDVDVIVNGINTKQTVATNTTELGVGFDYRGIDNSTNIYMEASYITGTDYSEISGNLGFRYSF